MAERKPAAAKKKPTKPAAPRKKTVAKKPAASKAKKAQSVRSFHLSRETESFISTSITRQTIYWAVLAIVILLVGVLILNSQLAILETLNQISDSI